MTLSTTQIEAVNTYAKFLKAGTTYGEAMRKAASELGDTPCITLIEELAKVHARHYGCNYTWNAKGAAVFHTGNESTRDTRHMAAYQSWQRNVMVWFKPAAAPKAKPSHGRVTAQAREAAMAFLAEFEGDTLAKQIDAAMRVLKAMR
jgi:hypothetical protein